MISMASRSRDTEDADWQDKNEVIYKFNESILQTDFQLNMEIIRFVVFRIAYNVREQKCCSANAGAEGTAAHRLRTAQKY